MKMLLIIFLCFALFLVSAQERKNYFPVWTFQKANSNIYGISVGLWDFAIKPKQTNTYGLRISLIGEGLIVPMIGNDPLPQNDSLFYATQQKLILAEKINGINLTASGTSCDCNINGISIGAIGHLVNKMNGVSAVGMINIATIHNGIQIGLIATEAYKMTGLQIGLFNNSKITRGIQIGIWNVNEKRKFPLINWNF